MGGGVDGRLPVWGIFMVDILWDEQVCGYQGERTVCNGECIGDGSAGKEREYW